jgi:hypothetical protein
MTHRNHSTSGTSSRVKAMRNRWEFAGTTSDSAQRLISTLVKVLSNFPKIITKFKSLIDAVDFHIWVNSNFHAPKHYSTKTALLREIIKTMESDSMKTNMNIIELGVAYGDTLRALQGISKNPFSYYGFDSFEGLPESWRGLPKGAFKHIGINNILYEKNDVHKVHFVVGWVEDTLQKFPELDPNEKKLILFDMDLFSPTLYSYEHFKNKLNPGDCVYFDEAFDGDERVIIKQYFLEDFESQIIGYSPLSLAFKIARRNDESK